VQIKKLDKSEWLFEQMQDWYLFERQILSTFEEIFGKTREHHEAPWPRPTVCRGQVAIADSGITFRNVMKETTKRSIFRWVHIVFAIPIAGYVYSPFKELPNYAPVVRYVALPAIVLTGLWMWKGHVLRRFISKRST